MYHALILRKVRTIFAGLNKGEYEATLRAMAPNFEHRFGGADGPLGGTRHTLPMFRLWFERLMRLTRGKLDVQLHHLVAAGRPWDATVVAEWTDTATLADGLPYSNNGVHVFRLRWFKAVSIHAVFDTAVWDAACARMLANGVAEAGAEPIVG
jgi:ketosteroid isomerase-like protein